MVLITYCIKTHQHYTILGKHLHAIMPCCVCFFIAFADEVCILTYCVVAEFNVFCAAAFLVSNCSVVLF
jgi:hypothetical protein